MSASGFLLFDKAAGKTSFAALGTFRKAFPGARLGHTGTLDSFATGLLIVVVGAYRRLAPWFVGLDKEYRAEIRFGIGTDTLDPSGEVTARGKIPSREDLEGVLPKFRGNIEQIPPDYSAIHVGGVRASQLATKGESFSLAPRRIIVYSLDLLSFDEGRGLASLAVRCSSGTYVRALARDMAAACGSCAHLSSLRRTRVGPFSVADAQAASGFAAAVQEASSPPEPLASPLRRLDPETALSMGLGVGYLRGKTEAAFRNGAKSALEESITTDVTGDRDIAVFSAGGDLLGIALRRSGRLAYGLVLAQEEREEDGK